MASRVGQEDTAMPSSFTKSFSVLAVLVVLLVGAPAFAQNQSMSGGDPFSDVPAVDSDEMSAVSGELAGGIGTGISTHIGTGNRSAGAQPSGGVPSNAIGTATRDISASGSHDFANQGTANVRIYNNNSGGAGGSGGVSQ